MNIPEIDLLIAICEDYFKQRNYDVRREQSLHQHVRWRPQIYASKGDESIALDVRLTDSIPRWFKDILKSARRLLPDLKIYVAIPTEGQFTSAYEKQTRSLGIGLFLINGTVLKQKVRPTKPRRRNFISTPSGRRAQAIIIRAGSWFAAWVELGQVFANANQYVKLLDPYCDEGTLEHLLHVKSDTEIKLVTAFSGPRKSQEPVFKAACRRFKKDYPKFEARKCDPKAIHDRYYITERETWMLGSSVKDVGLKFACLARVEDSHAKTEIERFFDNIWRGPSSATIV